MKQFKSCQSPMDDLEFQSQWTQKLTDKEFKQKKEDLKRLCSSWNIFWNLSRSNKYLRAKTRLYKSKVVYQSCLELAKTHGLSQKLNYQTLQKSFQAVDAFHPEEFDDFCIQKIAQLAFLAVNNIQYQEILSQEWAELPLKQVFLSKIHELKNSSSISEEYEQIKKKILISLDNENKNIPGMRQKIEADESSFKLVLMATRLSNTYAQVRREYPQIPLILYVCQAYIGCSQAYEVYEIIRDSVSWRYGIQIKRTVKQIHQAYNKLEQDFSFWRNSK